MSELKELHKKQIDLILADDSVGLYKLYCQHDVFAEGRGGSSGESFKERLEGPESLVYVAWASTGLIPWSIFASLPGVPGCLTQYKRWMMEKYAADIYPVDRNILEDPLIPNNGCRIKADRKQLEAFAQYQQQYVEAAGTVEV